MAGTNGFQDGGDLQHHRVMVLRPVADAQAGGPSGQNQVAAPVGTRCCEIIDTLPSRSTRRHNARMARRPVAAGRRRLHRADRRHRRLLGDADQLPRVRVLRHLLPRPARRPGRAEAGAATHPLLDAGDGGPARPRSREVRPGGRRGDGQVPPARRRGDLRRPGPHGAVVDDAADPGRRARQLRLPRRRPGRDALHRVPDGAGRAGHDRRAGLGHRRLQAQLRRQGHRADGAAGRVPQPAGQRGGRASRSAWPPTAPRTTWSRWSRPCGT